ncbi:MAG: hypothetical protein HY706_08280 [Candidatus Hydrogenedentes bacterium]|nr:hypothetical protein [Candidatus Hydrogenedentota bacterium]
MDQRQIFLRDILTILFKRKALILLFTVGVVGVVFVGNYAWPPTYESSAKVRLMRGREVSQPEPTVMRSAASIAMVQMTPEDVNSEIELIYSQDVLEQVAKRLELEKGLPVGGGPLKILFNGVKRVWDAIQYALQFKTAPEALQGAVEGLHEAILVEPVKNSHVLEIRCRLGDPILARNVLRETIDAYTKKHLEVFASPQGSPFFVEQMRRVEVDLAKAQSALEVFRQGHQITSVEAEKQLLLEQISDGKKLLVQLAESETATEAVSAGAGDSAITAALSRATDNTVVTEMQLRLLESVLERNRIMQSLGPKHPDVVAVTSEIENAQARLREAISTTRTTTESKVRELDERLKTLNELAAKLDELEREVRIQATAYEYYAQKREEARVTDAMAKAGISNIKIVSAASLPTSPILPRKLLNLAAALVSGLVGGLGIAFFLEYLDHGIKTPEDVQHFLKIPPMASFLHSAAGKLDSREAQRLASMLNTLFDAPLQLLQVTSSVTGESAERVARALAEARAENPYSKAIFIDFAGNGGDDLPKGPGVLEVLQGGTSLSEVVARVGNLTVVGRGSAGEGYTYLLNSDRMKTMLQELRDQFDSIVFNVSPVLQQSHDALALARAADGILLVIRADSTRREVVERAAGMLTEAKGKVIGAALTERKQTIPAAVYRRI